jgi:hypothetical protein
VFQSQYRCRPSRTNAWSKVALALVLLTSAARPAGAQDTSTFSYGLETAFRSGHSDRGFLISDRQVLQPVLWASWGRTAGYLWGNVPMAAASDGSRPWIVEAELSQTVEWNGFSITPATRMYFYRDPILYGSSRSLEVWLHLTRDVGVLTLFARQSVDLLDNRGGYSGEAGVASSAHVSPSLELGGSFGAGWANATFNEWWAGVAKPALSRVGVDGWVTVYVTPNVYLTPHVEFSTIVDRDVREGDLYRPTYFLFRLATGVEFQ